MIVLPCEIPAPAPIPKRFTYSRSVHRMLAGWVVAIGKQIEEFPSGGDPGQLAGLKKNLAGYRKMLAEYEGRLGC